MNLAKKSFLIIFLLSFLRVGIADDLNIEVEVDLGHDLGQNFGTIFEAYDKNGKLLLGAGFPAAYNSYFRNDRYQLQFFIRPSQNANYTLTKFANPNDHVLSNYLFSLNDQLLLMRDANNLIYNEADKSWQRQDNVSYDSAQLKAASVVRGKILGVNSTQELIYDHHPLINLATDPNYIYTYCYYAQGYLFFYRKETRVNGKMALVAVPWDPYTETSINFKHSKVLTILFQNEFSYCWGQINQEVVTGSNYGGVYSFKNDNWRIIRPASKINSFQLYSMLTYNNRLLLGHYPSGSMYEYDGHQIIVHNQFPATPTNVSSQLRELQTLMIYRGEIFAGVWPWAELWRLNPDTQRWKLIKRMFNSPKAINTADHPYEREALANGYLYNQLGQRLTSLIPYKNALIIGTSWKVGKEPVYTLDLINPTQLSEYGALHQFRLDGHLNGLLTWQDKPVKLKFVIHNREMSIYQDDVKIASTELVVDVNDLNINQIRFGQGIFGKLNGKIREL